MSAASSDPDAELPFSDWEVEGEALEVCRHPDGAPVVLGQGSFGTVSLLDAAPILQAARSDDHVGRVFAGCMAFFC